VTVLDDLRAALGADADAHVLTDPDLTESFGTDWTRRWSTRPLAVVRPGSVDAVAAVLQACHSHRAPVVTQGGNTGLVGASVPHRPDSVLLSTTRLDHREPVDTVSGQVTVGAGVTLADLQAHARAAGLTYGVDLAARDTATIGGTVATNAGGLRVCRFGDTRAQVTGLQAVLADGSVISRLDGLPKDGAGYDLVALLVGSEGTLGVVTAVRVRLHQPTPRRGHPRGLPQRRRGRGADPAARDRPAHGRAHDHGRAGADLPGHRPAAPAALSLARLPAAGHPGPARPARRRRGRGGRAARDLPRAAP
jgi:FAD/FMN-containing dehydrogenase